MATLRIDKLNKSYGEAAILRDIDLAIARANSSCWSGRLRLRQVRRSCA